MHRCLGALPPEEIQVIYCLLSEAPVLRVARYTDYLSPGAASGRGESFLPRRAVHFIDAHRPPDWVVVGPGPLRHSFIADNGQLPAIIAPAQLATPHKR